MKRQSFDIIFIAGFLNIVAGDIFDYQFSFRLHRVPKDTFCLLLITVIFDLFIAEYFRFEDVRAVDPALDRRT